MPRLNLFVTCEAATVDKQTNVLSLLNIIEEVTAKALPAVLPKLTLVVVWERDILNGEEEFEFRILVKDPNGKTMKTPQPFEGIKTSFKDKKSRMRNIITVYNFPIELNGKYSFGLELKEGEGWEEVGTSTITSKT